MLSNTARFNMYNRTGSGIPGMFHEIKSGSIKVKIIFIKWKGDLRRRKKNNNKKPAKKWRTWIARPKKEKNKKIFIENKEKETKK